MHQCFYSALCNPLFRLQILANNFFLYRYSQSLITKHHFILNRKKVFLVSNASNNFSENTIIMFYNTLR